MNPLQGRPAEERTHLSQFSRRSLVIAVSLLGAAIALVTINVWLYQHSRSLEYQYQHLLTKVRPWIVPEGACEVFLLAWFLTLIASCVAVFRIRDRILKCEAAFLVAGALVALALNAYCFLWEAFQF